MNSMWPIFEYTSSTYLEIFWIKICILLSLVLFLFGCGKFIHPISQDNSLYRTYSKGKNTTSFVSGYSQTGIASWYGKKFHRKTTANGEKYDMYAMTAAHKILPMDTKVRVINLQNGKKAVVRINDRGPFVKGRIIDLSYASAKKLGMVDHGTTRVKLLTLGKDLPKTSKKFYLQVGSFLKKQNARELQAEMENIFDSSTRIEKAQVKGKSYWRVQVGIFDFLSKAEKSRKKIQKNYPNAFVIAEE